ncbi:hypothetical protein [Nostoc sp.]|uniref:hypothetical protein n=1 Tax=Nostoc sp. TaxID=1180 RepID=UPI002FF70A32
MSEPELPSEKGKPSEKQINVDGLVFVFVLVPAILFVFSMVITDYLAQTPPVRSFDDAAPNSKALACQSRKQNEGSDAGNCQK